MRLIKVFDIINQVEKGAFLKRIDEFTVKIKDSDDEVNRILSQEESGAIKNFENKNIVKLFQLTKDQFSEHIKNKLQFNNFQLDILIDILVRDGNSIMDRGWFEKLYRDEISELQKHKKSFFNKVEGESKEIDSGRRRDYSIYKNCVRIAYENDEIWNKGKKIDRSEKTILDTLAQNLELSREEKRTINYSIVGLEKINIDKLINSLKDIGVLFFHKKDYLIYLPDEMAWLLRDLVGIELPNKYFRRLLRQLNDVEINRICNKHFIDSKLDRESKIKFILNQGVSVESVLLSDIYRDDTLKTEKKNRLQLLIKKLDLELTKLGTTAEERVSRLIEYFQNLEKDENIGISIDGYEKLLKDLNETFPKFNNEVKEEFELQQDFVLNFETLNNYNIKPLEVLDLLSNSQAKKFKDNQNIKKRGNVRKNILNNYKDAENLYLENFDLIGRRDLKGLKEKGIIIKESELGIKYENLSKKIFRLLGLDVDEKLRNKLNTKRTKIDILLNLGKNEVIIVECKTIKDSTYNKYEGVSRQLVSYKKLCENNGYRVRGIILVSDDFSQDFVDESEYDTNMNLSLVTSTGIIKILEGFKKSSRSRFPTNLLLKSGKLNEDRIVKAL